MSCERIENLLVAYADGELEAPGRDAVEAHLRTCPDCAALLDGLRTASASLAAFPEIEPGPELRRILEAIPRRKSAARRALDLVLKPSLQPFLAAASILLTFVSLYAIHPEKSAIDKAVSLTFRRGLGQVEKIYARAEAVTGSLSGFAENVYVSLDRLNPFKRGGE